MNTDINVIWSRGDGEMPERAKRIVEEAQAELLLRSLRLPYEIADLVRYYADKNASTISDYISAIVVEHFKVSN